MNNIPDHHELEAITQTALDAIIHKHILYARGQVGGARAVIQYHDLSGLNFNAEDLSYSDFTGCLLAGADMSHGIFKGASFFACDMRNANLSQSDFSRADFRGAYVAGANLIGANMSGVDLRQGKIMKKGKDGILEDRARSGGSGGQAVLSGARMTDTNMDGAFAHSADFSDADLTGATLTNAQLDDALFEGANLTDADMSRTSLTNVNMRSCILAGTNLNGAEIYGLDTQGSVQDHDMGKRLEDENMNLGELLTDHMQWIKTAGAQGQQLNLSGYDLHNVIDLKRYPLTAVICIGSSFIGQDFSQSELQSCTFNESDFRDCKFIDTDMRGSAFKGCNFTRSNLSGAQLNPLILERNGQNHKLRSDLSGSSFRFARIYEADLRNTIMMGADLRDSDFRGSDLSGADLTGARLKGANLNGVNLENTVIDMSEL